MFFKLAFLTLTYKEEITKPKRLQNRRQTPVAAGFNSQLLTSEYLQPAVPASLPPRGLKPPFESLPHTGVCPWRVPIVWRPLPPDEAAETQLCRQPRNGPTPQYIACNRVPVPMHTCREGDGAQGALTLNFLPFVMSNSNNVKISLTNNFVLNAFTEML